MLVLVVLPVPLVLWPVLGVLGSLALGIGYGYFTPLIATFEAVGEHVADKLYHCFIVSFTNWNTMDQHLIFFKVNV